MRNTAVASAAGRPLHCPMTSLPVLKERALALPASERMPPAAELLNSLPAVREDPDEVLAEALHRDQGLSGDPAAALSWPELKARLGR